MKLTIDKLHFSSLVYIFFQCSSILSTSTFYVLFITAYLSKGKTVMKTNLNF